MAIDEPTRRLSPRARDAWALEQLGMFGAATVAGFILANNVEAVAPWAWLVPLLVTVAATATVPFVRYRRWRWGMNERGLDIQHGTFTVRRTLVPWIRVQHVETRSGLIEQGLGLATVIVHTAAGSHTIPMLPSNDAIDLRNQIAETARVDE